MTSLLVALVAAISLFGVGMQPAPPGLTGTQRSALERATPVTVVPADSASDVSAEDMLRAARVLERRLSTRGVVNDVRIYGDGIVIRGIDLSRSQVRSLIAPRPTVEIHAWEPMKMRVYRTRREALADSPAMGPALKDGSGRVVTGDAARMATGGVDVHPTGTLPPNARGFALMFGPARLASQHFRHAYVGAEDTQNRTWSVLVELTPYGTQAFEDLTDELASDGARGQAAAAFAVIEGDRVLSVVIVDYLMYPTGIRGGVVQIAGLPSRAEAERIATLLGTGALPFPLRVVR